MRRPNCGGSARLAGLALLLPILLSAQVPAAKHPVRAPAPRPRSAFDLFATLGAVGVRLTANRVDCNWLWNYGTHCSNQYGSGTIEGGFWPAGTGEPYVFNGGLQVAAMVPANAGFGWAGDTVGVFFMDARGEQQAGITVTGLFDSRNANDLAAWPTAAYANDTSLFDPMLLGRAAVSDQDTWVRYWDGVPGAYGWLVGRSHAMGLVVDQRTMAWNRSVHRDIVYFTFRLINVTSRLASSYAGLSAYGYSAADQQALAGLGGAFQDTAMGRDPTLRIPAGGFTFRDLYAGYYQDPDVGNASDNFSTAVLPFSLAAVMKADYREPTWAYPASVFGSPFAAAPGFEAMQYLRGVADSGGGRTRIAVWSNLCGGCGLMYDPVGVSQLYRFLSGRVSPSLGDGVCDSSPIALHTCAVLQAYADTRYYESTGPTDLGPGQSVLIVMAMLYAAPVASQPATTNGIYAMPAFSLSAYQNPNLVVTYQPGFPATAETLAVVGTAAGTRVCTTACSFAGTIREPVERAMGWGQFSDANGDGRVAMNEVVTVPGSLLNKAQAAQALFDHKFLLPSAPDAPSFYLAPGDGKVTIAWQKSNSEAVGDAYFGVASLPLNPDGTVNPLYDPDYRQFDVQGYRIWRGTSASSLSVIAEFDVAGATFTDYTAQIYDLALYGNQCAPELGVTASCPTFPVAYPLVPSYGPPNATVIQVPLGGRALLANGAIELVQADTAFSARTGTLYYAVPYVFVDSTVRNSFEYVYAVTAFDVNSVRSGPSSLESPLVTKAVTPRVPSSNAEPAVVVTGMFGDDGVALDPNAAGIRVDSATGVFTGLVPPTNGASFILEAGVLEALPPGDITARIDSLVPGTVGGFGGPYASMYLSLSSGKDTVRRVIPFDPGAGYNQVNVTSTSNWVLDSTAAPLVHYDSARAAALGLSVLFKAGATMPVQFKTFIAPMGAISPGNLTISSQRYPWSGETAAQHHSALLNQPVWYDEGSAEPPQPTVNPFASAANTDGKLTGVSMIYQALTYRLPNTGTPPGINLLHRYVQYGTSLGHPGDFVVTWNADSTITVRDSTHHLNVPFRPDMGVSWGFVNERALTAAGVTAGDIADGTGAPTVGVVGYWHQYAIAPVCSLTFGATCAPLQNKAEYEPINYDNTGTANGHGISLYIDGSFFIMQMASLPAAGTKWHLKVLDGMVDATCSTYTPATPAAAATACSGYSYTPLPYRQPYVPGLSLKIQVTRGFTLAAASGDLTRIHTVPDPYYNHSGYETAGGPRQLRFVNLPDRAIIRIYSVSGILVRVLTHNDPTGGGEEPWDLLTREGQLVASGVYFWHVEAPDGRTRVGRMTIVNITTN